VTTYHRRRLVELKHAYDEARFGAERTLNLRASTPTVTDATFRTEAWLRERQASLGGEVLIITGRGNRSEDGYSVVREAVAKLLRSLKRKGVVEDLAEHTAGSFVVALAPMRRLFESPRRSRESPPPRPAPGATLVGLEPATRTLLHELATRSLDSLGIDADGSFLDDEMGRQLGLLLRAVPDGADREARLREAITRTLSEDDRGSRTPKGRRDRRD
jgi:hypothetical protein